MKFLIAFAALVAVALAAQPEDAAAQVVREVNENHEDGSYVHS